MSLLKSISAICVALLGTSQTSSAQDVYYYGSAVLFSQSGGSSGDVDGGKAGLAFQIDDQRFRFASEFTRLELPILDGKVFANSTTLSAQYTFDNALFFGISHFMSDSRFVDRRGNISSASFPDETRFTVGRETETLRFGVGVSSAQLSDKTDLFVEWYVRPQTYVAMQYTDKDLGDQVRLTAHHRTDDLTIFAEAQIENRSNVIVNGFATGFRSQSLFVSAEHRSFKNLAFTAQLYYAKIDRTPSGSRQQGIAVGAKYYFTPEFSTYLNVGRTSNRDDFFGSNSGTRISFGLTIETARPNQNFGLQANSQTRSTLLNSLN